jgi:hypothetical protein
VCTGLWWGNLKERDRWGDPSVDGRITLGWIFKKWDVGMWNGLGWLRRKWEDNVRMDLQEIGCGCEEWIGLAQGRDTWRALVNAVRNLRVP